MKRNDKRIFILILCLLFFVIAVVLYVNWKKEKNVIYPGTSANIDANASEWDHGLSAPTDMEHQIFVPGYSGAKMKSGDTTLNLRIGNPSENTCYLQATLQLEDGTILYESGLIEPGKGFNKIELTQTLTSGEYKAFVHYQGYSMEEEPEILNSCDSAFTLTVER